MVYSRSVITASLLAGAVSSILAVPVPTSQTTSLSPSVLSGFSWTQPSTGSPLLLRRGNDNGKRPASPESENNFDSWDDGKYSDKHQHKKVKTPNPKSRNWLRDKTRSWRDKVTERVRKAKQRMGSGATKKVALSSTEPDPAQAAGAAGETSTAQAQDASKTSASLGRRDHEEHYNHHEFFVFEEAAERADDAKERLDDAEKHLYHLFDIEDEGKFVSHRHPHGHHPAHDHGHDHFRLGKAFALASLGPDRHATPPLVEAPIAFEIAIAARGDRNTPSLAPATQQIAVRGPPHPPGHEEKELKNAANINKGSQPQDVVRQDVVRQGVENPSQGVVSPADFPGGLPAVSPPAGKVNGDQVSSAPVPSEQVAREQVAAAKPVVEVGAGTVTGKGDKARRAFYGEDLD